MKKTKVWQCTGCERGPCNLFTDEEAASVAFMCDYDPENCHWKESTKYQITEVPEPVYYLEYPEAAATFVTPSLAEMYGKTIHKNSGSFDALSELGWIKQKQPEPTREEFQIRLDAIKEYIKTGDTRHFVSEGSARILNELADGVKT